MALQGVSYITEAGRDAIAEALNSGQDLEIASYGLSSQDIEISAETKKTDLTNFLSENITVGSKSAVDGKAYVELRKTSDELAEDIRIISIYLSDGSLFIVIKPTYFIPKSRGLDFGLGIGVGDNNTELSVVNVVDGVKANIFGDCEVLFDVKYPQVDCNATNRKYVDEKLAEKAEKAGSQTQAFYVALATQPSHAPRLDQIEQLFKHNRAKVYTYEREDGVNTDIVEENIYGDTSVSLVGIKIKLFLLGELAFINMEIHIRGFGTQTARTDTQWNFKYDLLKRLKEISDITSIRNYTRGTGNFELNMLDDNGDEILDTSFQGLYTSLSSVDGLAYFKAEETTGFHRGQSEVDINEMIVYGNFITNVVRA